METQTLLDNLIRNSMILGFIWGAGSAALLALVISNSLSSNKEKS